MEDDNILDPISKATKSRFSKWSFIAFLISLLSFSLFLVFSFLNIGSSITDAITLVLIFGFIFSNIAGVVFTFLSLIKGETNTTYKIVGAIGNILFSFVLLGLIGFVIQDLITWF